MTQIVSVAAANAALNTYQIDQVSLHSGNPSTTGENEIDSAEYSRQPFSFAAADNARRYGVSDASFNLKAGDVIAWAAYWYEGAFVIAKALNAPITYSQDGSALLKADSTYLD